MSSIKTLLEDFNKLIRVLDPKILEYNLLCRESNEIVNESGNTGNIKLLKSVFSNQQKIVNRYNALVDLKRESKRIYDEFINKKKYTKVEIAKIKHDYESLFNFCNDLPIEYEKDKGIIQELRLELNKPNYLPVLNKLSLTLTRGMKDVFDTNYLNQYQDIYNRIENYKAHQELVNDEIIEMLTSEIKDLVNDYQKKDKALNDLQDEYQLAFNRIRLISNKINKALSVNQYYSDVQLDRINQELNVILEKLYQLLYIPSEKDETRNSIMARSIYYSKNAMVLNDFCNRYEDGVDNLISLSQELIKVLKERNIKK